jgi:putative oxidoreductase
MKALLLSLFRFNLNAVAVHVTLLAFRAAVSVELITVHGLKKIGIGLAQPEQVPNPVGLPVWLNEGIGISANLIFPLFVMAGLLTRLAALPILAVTVTGFFYHLHSDPLVRDTPYMYSVCFLMILVAGPGRYSLDARWASWLGKQQKANTPLVNGVTV